MVVKEWKLDRWLKRSILETDVEDARKSLVPGAYPDHGMVEREVRYIPLTQAAAKHPDLVGLLNMARTCMARIGLERPHSILRTIPEPSSSCSPQAQTPIPRH